MKSVSGIKNSDNRSVRDIKPNHTKASERDNNSSADGQPPRRSHNKKAATYGLWFIGIVVLLLLFFLFSVLFTKTTVTVTPRTAPISVDSQYTAQSVGSGTSSVDTLNYTVTSVQETRSQPVETTETEYRQKKARGDITIVNEHSQSSLQLVANTRFRSPDGNIYRTQSAVTVPGISNGQPGETTATVVADSPGSSYNVDPDVRLSVPGFAGTPQEGEVYARSKMAIDGGVDREVPLVGTSTRERIAQSLTDNLRAKLESDLTSQLTDSQIVYDQAKFFRTNTTAETSESGEPEVVVTGSLQAVTFDRRGLSIFLANQSGINASADTNMYVQNLDDFSFDLADESFSPDSRSQLPFSLSGDSLVVWEFNQQALTRDLVGLQKSQVKEVLDNYPSIQSATVNTRPFWKRSLPTDREDITIKTNLPTG